MSEVIGSTETIEPVVEKTLDDYLRELPDDEALLKEMGVDSDTPDQGSEGEPTQADKDSATLNSAATDASDEAAADTSPSHPMNMGDVMKYLEAQNPDAVKVVKGVQRRLSSMENERNAMKDEMRELRDSVEALVTTHSNPEPAEDDAPRFVLSEKDEAILEQELSRRGVVTREQLEQEKQTEAQERAAAAKAAYEREQLEKGSKEFGENFAVQDDMGQFYVSDEWADAYNEVLARVQDPARGLTTRDMFLIARGSVGAPAPATEEASQPSTPGAPSRAARTVRRTSAGATGDNDPVYYDPKRDGDNPDALDLVMRRMDAVARKRGL
jgi:hypothetical protein